MKEMTKMKLVLENGLEFSGAGYGSTGQSVFGEVVFNTSMVGYQEIISDPAYAGQIVVMTYPLIGQYGITDEDFEAKQLSIAGLVVKECCDTPSNFRYTKTLSEELEEHGIPCLSGVDTRMLTRIIRTQGCMKGAIVSESMPGEEALALIRTSDPLKNAVEKVSCRKRWFSRTAQHNFDVVIVDCGAKHSIVSALNNRGCNATIVPFNSTAEEVLAFNPDGVLISNGPGDPAELQCILDLIAGLKGRLPIYGICLGQCLIALSYGAKITKLPYGHHGGRPVRSMEDGRIVTAEHNHNYAVDKASLEGTGLTVTWSDVSDGTVEGIECAADRVRAVQFYPEGAPGPEETQFFDRFVKAMEK